MAKWLNSLGISAFVLKYRVPALAWAEGGDVALMDGHRALSLARARAESLHLSPSKIGLMGASAGGLLATRVATAAARSYPRIDDVDDLRFLPDFLLLLYPGVTPEAIRTAGRVPSTFIAMAADDPCVNVNTVVSFFEAMQSQGAPTSELHVYPSGRHGWGTCERYPNWQHHDVCKWPQRAELFLASHLHLNPGNVTGMTLVSDTESKWCPPAQGSCIPRSRCVGHCTATCWAGCH